MTSKSKTVTPRNIYLRDIHNSPVGCVSYADLHDGNFAYGVSFLNPVVDQVDKRMALHIADGRLGLAIHNITNASRKHCQGRFGIVSVKGSNFNEKVANLISQIREQSLHRNDDVASRMRSDLRDCELRLLTKRSTAA